MEGRFLAALAILTLLAPGAPTPARAQIGYLGPNLNLTPDDLAMMGKAARELHDKPQGTAIPWSNPQSGNSGTATLVSTSTLNGQPCHAIQQTINATASPTPQSYVLTYCRQPNGSWLIPP